jgi:hypothetical protein
MLTGLVRTLTAASAMLAAGCSLAVDPDQVQCLVQADCAAIGYPDMECVGSVCVSPQQTAFACQDVEWPPASTSEMVRISITALALGTDQPVSGLTVNICNTLIDAQCSNPVGQSATNSEGVANLDVLEGFRGHFLVPAIAETAPYILHMNPPPNPAAASTLQGNLTITNLTNVAGLAMLAGETFVADRGHLFFSTRDCEGNLLPGVSVNVVNAPPEAAVAYLGTNNNPDPNLESTGANSRGAVINLQPGFVTVQGIHDEYGQIFEQTLLVSANTITSTPIVPSPF